MTDMSSSVAPRDDKSFVVAQYEQLHEMRREYNRFIFQAPTIVVAVIGGSLVFMGQGAGDASLEPALSAIVKNWAPVLVVLAGFLFVIGYWSLRSQVLLRRSEQTLHELEVANGSGNLLMYPFQVSHELRWWQRGRSTLYIVGYILILSVLFLGLGLWGLIASF